MSDSGFSKYNRKDNYRSKYFYPNSEVLINFQSIEDEEELKIFEEGVTKIRQLMIEEELSVTGRFTVTHLRKLHKFIFQDVYPFSGNFRTEDISKGDTIFTRSKFIENQLKTLLNQLKSEKYLKNLNEDEFIKRVSYYFIELNMIHPFREGNGRTIRIFLRQLGIYCGYEFDWTKIQREELISAMIAGAVKIYEPLEICLKKALWHNK